MTEPVRILLVDDHADVRRLFRIALERESDLSIVGEAEDGLTGVDAARALQPDLVLLDLSMPNLDGLEAMRLIRRASPKSHVVVLSGFKRERLEDIVVRLGATGYIEKGVRPLEMAPILRDALTRPIPPLNEPREEDLRRIEELV